MQTRLNLDATFLTGFPSQPWLEGVSYDPYEATNFVFNGKTIYRHIIRYTSCGRDRRILVIAPTMKPASIDHSQTPPSVQQGTKPMMIVCLPGSNDNSDGDNNGANDGAWDLTENIGAGELQFQYPLHLVADLDIYAVAMDGPVFGEFSYPNITCVESLVDDIAGVEAARWFLSQHMSFPIYGMLPPKLNTGVIGFSWGAIRAQFLAAALADCVFAYIAGGQLSKHYDQREIFNPAAWAAGDIDYDDMLLASNVFRCRHMFGASNDYLYAPFSDGNSANPTMTYTPPPGMGSPRTVPNAPYVLAQLEASSTSGRFSSVLVPGIGHQVDLTDLKTWITNNYGWAIANLPPYEAA